MILSANFIKGTSLFVLLGMAVGFSVGLQEMSGSRGSVLVGGLVTVPIPVPFNTCYTGDGGTDVIIYSAGPANNCGNLGGVEGTLQEGECYWDPWECIIWSCEDQGSGPTISSPPSYQTTAMDNFLCAYKGCTCTECPNGQSDCDGLDMPLNDPNFPGIDMWGKHKWICTDQPSYEHPIPFLGATGKMCKL